MKKLNGQWNFEKSRWQDIEELKKQIAKHCEKLERDVDQVELLVKRNKELESKNREILERDNELNKQLSELQERLATKEKVRFYVQNRFLRWNR